MSGPVEVTLVDLDEGGDPHDGPGLVVDDLVAAAQIRDAERRHRFLASRRAVRVLLADATGARPDRLAIVRGRNGKPELPGTGVHFSSARRGRWGVVAVSRAHPVGVDVEQVQTAQPPPSLVRFVLPPRAREAVASAPEADRPREFALVWSRIEAAVKACGAGLDEAEACLAAAPQRAGLVRPGWVVAVAGRTTAALDVRWAVAPRELTGAVA